MESEAKVVGVVAVVAVVVEQENHATFLREQKEKEANLWAGNRNEVP